MLGQNQTKIVDLAQRFSQKLHFSDFSLLIVPYHPARLKKNIVREYLEIKVRITGATITAKLPIWPKRGIFWETLFAYFFSLLSYIMLQSLKKSLE